MHLELETTCDGDARRILMARLALDTSLDGGVQEALAKALGEHPLLRPTDPYLLSLFNAEIELYHTTLEDLRDQIDDWLFDLEPVAKSQFFFKSRMAPRRPLTATEIAHLQTLISQTFEAVTQAFNSQPFTVPAAVIAEWKRQGIIAQTITAHNFIRNAYVFGRLKKALEDRGVTTVQQIQRAVTTWEPDLLDLQMIKAAEARAASAIVGLGGRLAAQAGTQVAVQNQTIIHQMVVEAVKGKLPITTAEGLPSGLFTGDWRRLASELYHKFKGTPQANRDWDRIAYFETQDAFHIGETNDLLRQFGGDLRVFRKPKSNACKPCRELYLNPDGTHREYLLSTVIASGSNIGKKASLIGQLGGWQAVAGLSHPWCRCSAWNIVFPQ